MFLSHLANCVCYIFSVYFTITKKFSMCVFMIHFFKAIIKFLKKNLKFFFFK
jgi:hypothetical protein